MVDFLKELIESLIGEIPAWFFWLIFGILLLIVLCIVYQIYKCFESLFMFLKCLFCWKCCFGCCNNKDHDNKNFDEPIDYTEESEVEA